MNAIAAPTPSAAPKAAWICLLVGWLCFLIPFPGLGLFVGWPLNLAAFILAIVAMSKRGAGAGIGQLLASLIASPIVYFIGLAIFAGSIGAAAEASRVEAATPATPEPSIAQAADAQPVSAATLIAQYESNEVAADQTFKGRSLRVSGKVESIDSGMADEPIVQLSGGSNSFDSVHAKGLEASVAASLAKGQDVTLVCTGAGEVLGSPMLEGCSVQ